MTPEITLLCSIHKEKGGCSSAELARILGHIVPDVLFQEVPYFELLEKNQSWVQDILEIRAIAEHLKRHKVLQVPVDTFGVSAGGEEEQFDQVIDRVSHTSPEYCHLWDTAISNEKAGGFSYLNSRSNDALFRKSDRIVMKTLKELKADRLVRIFAAWKDHNSKRDEAMIRNIYEFCRRTNFSKGVFLFGSGHRQSLINKIRTTRKTETVRIDWKLGYDASRFGAGSA